jgi:Ca-activated chloride channel family protein
MKWVYLIAALSWVSWWWTPDQQGDKHFKQGDFGTAAELFEDPMRQGVARFRAGEFNKAVEAFGRVGSPEANYNAGNTWIMLGKYDKAITAYDLALQERPTWKAAIENRQLATLRAKSHEQKGGDLGDQREGADKIVFDKNQKTAGEVTLIADQAATNDSVQAQWLRNVQTDPATFLKAKFAYQSQQQANQEKP